MTASDADEVRRSAGGPPARTADEVLAQAHRQWFGRLVGWLFRMTGDLQLAEDAVGTAFASAVPAWRTKGAPDAPEAWLRVVARNEAMRLLTRAARTIAVPPEEFTMREAEVPASDPPADDRLDLMFVCAHPAIDSRLHAPLMLQAVLGVDAARIASVFLVPPATMGQRLSRAKTKIRDAGIRFRRPEPDELPTRLASVLQAVYAAYGLADPTATAADERDASLRGEALRLAQLLTRLAPDEPEVWGLHALLLHTESRRPARIVDGVFVPLAAQDTGLWSASARMLADQSLRTASRAGRPGRFQLEAAISAVHSSRADTGLTDWSAIATLYGGLRVLAPSIGATIGNAAALVELGRLGEASALLDALPAEAVADHQPYWVCRARLEEARGEREAALAASDRAIGLTTDPAIRAHLVRNRPG
jgi:RNA polymerase sigma-70 factor (ECF subfamily)